MIEVDQDAIEKAFVAKLDDLKRLVHVTLFDYFQTPGNERRRRRNERAALSRNGTLTIHEFMMAVMEVDGVFLDDFESLAEIPRDPTNDLEALYHLYEAAFIDTECPS